MNRFSQNLRRRKLWTNFHETFEGEKYEPIFTKLSKEKSMNRFSRNLRKRKLWTDFHETCEGDMGTKGIKERKKKETKQGKKIVKDWYTKKERYRCWNSTSCFDCRRLSVYSRHLQLLWQHFLQLSAVICFDFTIIVKYKFKLQTPVKGVLS